tara:strand:- start:76 stop:1419 length:1344 start_codon:yes stop_codon:yes gene_type:complete
MTEAHTTRALAEFITAPHALPQEVRLAGERAFVNIVGCMLGGVDQDATRIARELALTMSGAPVVPLIGFDQKTDALTSAFLNCLASAAHAFDDTHLATVVHPSGPVSAPMLAVAAERGMTGAALVDALVIGIEVQCRLGAALLLPPAKGQLSWYGTGILGGLGAAAAVARVLGLSVEQTCWALGLAANQASGFRHTHGSMCTSFTPAHASRCGFHAALLAERGMHATEAALEGQHGFFDVFSHNANAAAVTHALGLDWQMLANAFKPYPCGIVVHPVLDACLAIAREDQPATDNIAQIDVSVNPLCLMLCDRPAPPDAQLAQVSVQHWAAAALATGRAGVNEGSNAAVQHPDIQHLRSLVRTYPNDTIGRDGARVDVRLRDGTTITRAVANALGSAANPMTDEQIDQKFLDQAQTVFDAHRAHDALAACRAVAAAPSLEAVFSICVR